MIIITQKNQINIPISSLDLVFLLLLILLFNYNSSSSSSTLFNYIIIPIYESNKYPYSFASSFFYFVVGKRCCVFDIGLSREDDLKRGYIISVFVVVYIVES